MIYLVISLSKCNRRKKITTWKKKSKWPQGRIFQYIPPLGSVLLHDKLPEIICGDKWVLWQTWVLIFFGGCQFLSGWQGTSAPALTTLQNWQPANITLVLAAPLQNTNAHKRNTEQTKTKHKWQPTNMARPLWNKWWWLQIWSTVHFQGAEMNPPAKDLNIQSQGVSSQVNIPEIDETFKGSLTLFPQYDIYTSC